MCGFIAQLVEHRTGIAEVMGSFTSSQSVTWSSTAHDPGVGRVREGV